MRKSFVTAMALALAGCATMGELEGFDEVAAQSEVVSVTGAGWGRSGDFSIAPLGLTGTFKRSAERSGVDGDNLAQGRLTFELVDEGEFAGLQAECAHSRMTFDTAEEITSTTSIETRTVTGPYVLTCGFFRGDKDIGGMEMREERGTGMFDARVLRSGNAEVGGAEMRLTSLHRMIGTGIQSDTPLGYAMDFQNRAEAMLFSNGPNRKIALPREGRDERAAAMLAGIALSLNWDPGDED